MEGHRHVDCGEGRAKGSRRGSSPTGRERAEIEAREGGASGATDAAGEPIKFPRPPELDLFGNPALPHRERRGRPAHKPTAALRAEVAGMHRAGETQHAIAKAVGLTVPTLTAHYFVELESNASNRRNLKGSDNARN